MGGQGGVRLAVLYPELFAAAASMGGGAGAETEVAAEKNAAVLKKRNVGFLMINGEKDRPQAFEALAGKLNAGGVENTIIVHPGLGHDLGAYYELSYGKLMPFLGAHLKSE
jgi:poly(3-hydroxybutyrate) depolymerase